MLLICVSLLVSETECVNQGSLPVALSIPVMCSVYETEMLKVWRITGKLLVTLQAMLEAPKKLSSVISDEM